MENDPRDFVCAGGLLATNDDLTGWTPGRLESNRVEWHDIVAFATAILAANEAWLDSQTPTLEGLRERYGSQWDYIGVCLQLPTQERWAASAWRNLARHADMINEGGFLTEYAALRWLAAELAKRGGE